MQVVKKMAQLRLQKKKIARKAAAALKKADKAAEAAAKALGKEVASASIASSAASSNRLEPSQKRSRFKISTLLGSNIKSSAEDVESVTD